MAKAKVPDGDYYGSGASIPKEISDLLKSVPGKIIGSPPIETYPTELSATFKDPSFIIDDMDLKEVIELFIEEIDSLNRRVRELER